jgi:adenylylsulfate kinase-like enzyme
MDSPYEEPPHPEIRLDTSSSSVDDCVASLIDYLLKRKLIAD